MNSKRFISFVTLLLLFVSLLRSQDVTPVQQVEDTIRRNALKIFLDCYSCDQDFIRKEIEYINYVRDRKEAQVHIMVTTQTTGSGGREYTFHFLGQNEFANMNDTLVYAASQDDTEDMIRREQVRIIQMGLARFVARTPLSKYLSIGYHSPEQKEEVVEDKWKSWVFDLSLNGYLNGQKSRKSFNYYGSVVVRKVTPEWKYYFRGGYSASEDRIDTGTEWITSSISSKSFSGVIVKSLTDHWSVGGRFGASSSSFSNYRFAYHLDPGIEYDVFPYSESTRKQLRLLYTAGFRYNDYMDTTIYDKTEEYLTFHSLDVAFEVTQKWGSVDASVNWSNYFFDWSKNNLSVSGGVNLRIAKGLRLNFGGYVSLIHDQLNLVKGGATTEEILLYRKELETSYSYFTYFGFTYTFGSIYNNVVNPRFGSGSGGRSIIFM